MNSVQIDLLFGSLDNESLSLNELKTVETSQRSLLGIKDTFAILEIIPPESLSSFQNALRFIKLWAKLRGIYGISKGYFGGISLAIMLAKVVLLYPSASSETLVFCFFKLFSSWNWKFPVQLTNRVKNNGSFSVMTPTEPEMNSMKLVNKSSKKLLERELKRAAMCSSLEQILDTEDTIEYSHFIEIRLDSQSENFYKESAKVESSLKKLVNDLESKVESANILKSETSKGEPFLIGIETEWMDEYYFEKMVRSFFESWVRLWVGFPVEMILIHSE